MVPLDYIPNSVRRLLLDGLGRLIRHLAGLSEEVRHGLIHVISRSVSESIESTLYGVSRRQTISSIESGPIDQTGPADAESLSDWNKDRTVFDTDDDDQDEDLQEEQFSPTVERDREGRDPIQLPIRSANPWWLTTVAGLCGLATWFGSAGLKPLATATSILAGTILVFLG
ncbi:MAG: hypothetical protein U0798_19295 [Gemmataceae bacterium]